MDSYKSPTVANLISLLNLPSPPPDANNLIVSHLTTLLPTFCSSTKHTGLPFDPTDVSSITMCLLTSPLHTYYTTTFKGPMPPLKQYMALLTSLTFSPTNYAVATFAAFKTQTVQLLLPLPPAPYTHGHILAFKALLTAIINTLTSNNKLALLPPWQSMLYATDLHLHLVYGDSHAHNHPGEPPKHTDPLTLDFYALASANALPTSLPTSLPPLSDLASLRHHHLAIACNTPPPSTSPYASLAPLLSADDLLRVHFNTNFLPPHPLPPGGPLTDQSSDLLAYLTVIVVAAAAAANSTSATPPCPLSLATHPHHTVLLGIQHYLSGHNVTFPQLDDLPALLQYTNIALQLTTPHPPSMPPTPTPGDPIAPLHATVSALHQTAATVTAIVNYSFSNPVPIPSSPSSYLASLSDIVTGAVTKETSRRLIRLAKLNLNADQSLPATVKFGVYGLLSRCYLSEPAKAVKIAMREPQSVPALLTMLECAAAMPVETVENVLREGGGENIALWVKGAIARAVAREDLESGVVAKFLRYYDDSVSVARTMVESVLGPVTRIDAVARLAEGYERREMYEPALKCWWEVVQERDTAADRIKAASCAMLIARWEEVLELVEPVDAAACETSERTMLAYIKCYVAAKLFHENNAIGARGHGIQSVKATAAEHAETLISCNLFAGVKVVGDLLFLTGDLIRARVAYQNAIDLTIAASTTEPTELLNLRLAGAYNDLGATYIGSDWGLAVDTFLSALNAAPVYRAFTGLGLALVGAGRFEDGVAVISHGIDKEGREINSEAWRCLGRLYVQGMMEGRIDKSLVERTLDVLSNVCDDPQNWVYRGLYFLKEGDMLNAEKAFQTSFAGEYDEAGLAGYVNSCGQRVEGVEGFDAIGVAREAVTYYRILRGKGGEGEGWTSRQPNGIGMDAVDEMMIQAKAMCGVDDFAAAGKLAKEARALCDVRMKSGSAEVKARLFAECIALDVWCEVCEGVEQGGEAMARIKLDVMRAKRWDMGNDFVDKCFEQVQAL